MAYFLIITKKTFQNLKKSFMVRLVETLSNPSPPLLRLLEEVGRPSSFKHLQALFETHPAHANREKAGSFKPLSLIVRVAVSQVVTVERRRVRRKINENRRLSPAESIELANAYRAGASQVALARRFGVHKHTVRAHLQRHEVAFRPVRSLTASQEVEVVRLHGEEAWSLMQLAMRFAVDEKTVRNVLARQRAREVQPSDGAAS